MLTTILTVQAALAPSPVPFWIAFIATLVLIAAALITGFRGIRKLHLVLGPGAMVMLVVAIVLTEQLARRYEFPAEALRIHLFFAKSAAFLALPVIGTGIWYWRSRRARRWHLVSIFVWLAATLTATGTGLWMFSGAVMK